MNWNNKSFQPERFTSLEAADVKQSCGSLSFLNDANPPSGGFPDERQTCFKPELTGHNSTIVCKRYLVKREVDGDAFSA